jgi:phosphohistidine phosphatase
LKELILLRHAKSSWDDPGKDDVERPLSARGRRAATRMAQWLAQVRVRPSFVLCSDALRTRQTLALIHAAIGAPDVAYEKQLYLASKTKLLGRLRKLNDALRCVMLIGHNPGLQELALALLPKDAAVEREKIAAKFPTAATVRLAFDGASWSDLGPGKTRLIAYVVPRELAD